MKKIALSLAAAALLGVSSAGAQTVYGQIGTTGFGVGYARHYDSFNLRADVNFLHLNRDFNAGSLSYGATLKFANVGLYADYFAVGQFRITGGVTLGRDKADAHASAAAGTISEQNEWVQAGIKSRTARPYIGIGWGMGPKASKGLSFSADLGASYGSYKTDFDVSPALMAQWGPERAEAERRALDDKLDNYKWWPVVRLGVTYRF